MSKLTRQVDRAAALQALSGVESLLKDLAAMFCEDAPNCLEELSNCIREADYGTAKRLAHTLKGRAAAFFAQPTMKWAADLESALQQDFSQNELEQKLKILKEHVEGLCGELREI